MGDPDRTSRLNRWALGIGFMAAFLLAFFPPQVQQYTKEGAAHLTLTGRVSWWGAIQWWLSWAGPVLLFVTFLLQFLALRSVVGRRDDEDV